MYLKALWPMIFPFPSLISPVSRSSAFLIFNPKAASSLVFPLRAYFCCLMELNESVPTLADSVKFICSKDEVIGTEPLLLFSEIMLKTGSDDSDLTFWEVWEIADTDFCSSSSESSSSSSSSISSSLASSTSTSSHSSSLPILSSNVSSFCYSIFLSVF